MKKRKKGCLITFEGGEGAGKSTQIEKARQFFISKGRKVLVLREPGGTEAGEAIRSVILSGRKEKLSPEAELLLYLSARAQIVREKIIPALQSGTVVLCDRFEDSTLAYQGFGRGISIPWIKTLSRFVRGKVEPQMTFLLDIAPGKGLKRGGRHDRIEKESLEFHKRVRSGFLAIARKNSRRVKKIDASLPPDQVFSAIQKYLSTGHRFC